ncbi:MAG: KH domain-containing protein [Chloroflexi bacterium]|nr:KH domain-containing protein [Chloroflexota bacterium]
MLREEHRANLRDLVAYIAQELVDRPEEVRVTQVRGTQATIIRLRVAPADKGWVIGRKGRVANAIRSILRVAAPSNRHIVLEIL